MLSNITTVLNRRRFRFVFAALSLFFFIFSRKAEAFYQENNNLGRSLLQDHHYSSAHAEWQKMKMDEKGEFWDHVAGHLRNRRREEEEGPLRWADSFSFFLLFYLVYFLKTHHISLSLFLSLSLCKPRSADAYWTSVVRKLVHAFIRKHAEISWGVK